MVTIRRSTKGARARAAASGREGFTLLGLLVLIAIINIGLGVAATSWVVIGKRAKETELIWRGQQYVRAMQCHREQTGGLPEQLDELLDSNCIRALYPEPMNPGRGWRVIRESDLRTEGGTTSSSDALLSPAEEMLDRLAGSGRPSSPGGGNTGGQPARSGLDLGRVPADRLSVQNDNVRAATERLRGRLLELTDRLRQNRAGATGNGIIGVASFSTDESLRLYEGESTYDAWRFVAR